MDEASDGQRMAFGLLSVSGECCIAEAVIFKTEGVFLAWYCLERLSVDVFGFGAVEFRMNARSAVVRLEPNGKLKTLWVEGGTVAWGNDSLASHTMVVGKVEKTTQHDITISVENWPTPRPRQAPRA